ncbi:MAG: hypothetical protein J6A36_01180 [Clostridia bacterium]|nr:hypothetical protein [Clostridia bacterium]
MGILSALLDLYENARKTKTDEKNNKPKERNYNFDAGLTGDKKIDCPVYKPSEKTKVSEKEIDTNNEPEGR